MRVDYLDRLEVSASALAAYRQRMNAIAENLANAQTTRTPEGGPYRRQEVVFEAGAVPAAGDAGGGRGAVESALSGPRSVRARVVADTTTPFTEIYDPGHPDADGNGIVRYPNVNPVTEMVNLVLAARAYEANVAALQAEKRMQELSLGIGRA
ncbi:MAG: flagellar basal body rod protein FlgC [Candidatus Eisenbacteria bacterium]|uniref:Flagellar basal-body rod protein FlgC n=1 Tax=Eiseniibacteriota bacterium TaxID=2212470 RepID=A0A938BPU8_UNCEI|nr:flagellar basal body rod protein FlgC [Candidatus Eisenbacteria bacterium]